MSYIQELSEKLDTKLAGFPEEVREEIIDYVKDCVVESYRNGLRDGAKKRAGAPRWWKRA